MTRQLLTVSAFASVLLMAQETPTPVFRTTVTARMIKSINYQHRQGATTIAFAGTSLMPKAEGQARVDSKTGATKLDASFAKLPPAQVHGDEFLTYVLWAITPEGRAENLGEVMVDGDNARLQSASELQAFGLIVTAEPYWAVTQPSDVVVMEGVVKEGATTGTISPVEAKYELLAKGAYDAALPAAERAILKQKNDSPLDLKEARHAMAIARSLGAEKFAGDTMKKAAVDLYNAETFWQTRKDKKRVQALARNVTQLAEDARLISVRKQDEARLAEERRLAEATIAQAKSDTERETRRSELAEMDRVRAVERERLATLEAAQESIRRRRAEAESADLEQARAEAQRMLAESKVSEAKVLEELTKSRADADSERQRLEQQVQAARDGVAAERARLELAKAEALREQQSLRDETERIRKENQEVRQKAAEAESRVKQAEQERMQAREDLRKQLNVVLETRDSARGLIVNMSDVLFDTGQATLRAGAREKLAKVAGIVLAHSELKLQVEGHTDSVGGDSFNQKLSERRAEAVSQYLKASGVKGDSIASAGFGKLKPVASNDTAAGRQQNRRVELVVSGESIQAPVSAGR